MDTGTSLAPIFSYDEKSTGFSAFTLRFPDILNKTIDFFRESELAQNQNHTEKMQDLNRIIEEIEILIKSMINSHEFVPIRDNSEDSYLWNTEIKKSITYNGSCKKCWKHCSFLFSESYYYRKLFEIFQSSRFYQNFDYFLHLKKQSAYQSKDIMEIHARFLLDILSSRPQANKDHLTHFLYYSIFCNKMDLSLTAGNQVSSDCLQSISSNFTESEGDLLINDVDSVCQHLLSKTETSSSTVHLVLDNAGLEFFSDICLSIYLLQTGLASDVVFHVKSYPWYVSDVTLTDVDFFLDFLSSFKDKSFVFISDLLKKYISEGLFLFVCDLSWNFGFQYSDLLEMWPSFKRIYTDFTQSKLVIFKGDLNYRRLTGELQWDLETPFRKTLKNFVGFPLLALRMVKSDLVVGLDAETAKLTREFDENWAQTGQKGLLCFVSN